ncbi:hypothetical protein X797_000823 [Metarhizium robertsii]|uniref:Uncharacterized protein n=2 Tax=Metarhizium robertsii TaxID=568076 RepID=A0A0B2XIS3_METRA|nr:uncharacterized protein MAA_10680 [Metarhizium robertsii ARSEF 23]EXV06106.1 hypothetical protein X797_000823 [Metarhizium robertsii]KHO11736.1 hypothetical protein MAA_10680 [Metarhizium robertsii ARSEF 23]
MYIPLRESQSRAAGQEAHDRSGGLEYSPPWVAKLHHEARRRLNISTYTSRRALNGAALGKRQFSSGAADTTNVQIGIALGIILGVFLIATGAFLYMYRSSVRFTYRKHRRHHTKSSRSSSKSTESTPPPAPAPPPPAPEAEPPK